MESTHDMESSHRMTQILAPSLILLGIVGLGAAGILLCMVFFQISNIPGGVPPWPYLIPMGLPMVIILLAALLLLSLSAILMLLVQAVEYLKRLDENTRGMALPPQR